MWRNKSLKKNEKGQALIELALALPIFLIIIFGFIKVSYLLLAKQIITYAAREGARIGALTNDNSQMRTAVWDIIKPIDTIDKDGSAKYTEVIITPEDENDPLRDRGNSLSVKVIYPFHLNIPYVETGSLFIESESIARMEHE